jgi:hypothetical protein
VGGGFTSADQCQRVVHQQVDRFVGQRLRTLQNCANDALTRGGLDSTCCLAIPTSFGTKLCSTDGLSELDLYQRCDHLSSACDDIVVTNPSSLNACLQCRLTHVLNCMVATTYAISGPETPRCFSP